MRLSSKRLGWFPPIAALALAAAALLPAAAPASQATTSSELVAGGPVVDLRPAGPAAPSLAGPLVEATARNWAGYAITSLTGTRYNNVHADYRQKPVTCGTSNSRVLYWVGLDGFGSGTVEQGGTKAECFNGAAFYDLWWEMYPTNAIQTVSSVDAGDSISIDVTFDPATALFKITLNNNTKQTHFTTSQPCGPGLTCNRSSAEWIIEDPAVFTTGEYRPLANFGQTLMNFTGAKDDAGHSGSMTRATPDWRRTRLQMQDATTTYATTGHTSTNGQNFAVTWAHE